MNHNPETEIIIGKISGVYGLQGWLKVKSWTRPIDNIEHYSVWKLQINGHRIDQVVENIKIHNKTIIVKLKDYHNRTEVESLVGADILINKNFLPKPAMGEYYWHQLEGLTVFNNEKINLGKVHHLMDTGANDVLIVKSTDFSIDDRERLIPWIEYQVILFVDLHHRHIIVNWDYLF